MSEFRMPSLGADMDAATLVEWCVRPGEVVERGRIVAVVETQKGAIDVEFFDEGEFVELVVQPDTKVPVGAVLAIYRRPGEVLEPRPSAGPPAPAPEPARPAPEPARPAPEPARPAPEPARPRRVAPRARKLAEQHGLDLDRIAGTGPDGSITGEDVEAAVRAQAEPQRPPTRAPGGMRDAIAAAMTRSKREIPHYYLFHTVDLEPALTWLEARNAARPVAERLLIVALMVRALALSLREHRELCGFWRDDAFVPSEAIHVGLAVSLREGGLINPAIHDADQGSLEQLMARIRDVSQRARNGGLRASELSDSAITLTSLGDLGVDGVLGVISPPQVAIVGVGCIRERPWVVDGQIVVRRLVEIGLSADHRVSDGHAGARFLRRFERLLQSPESLQ